MALKNTKYNVFYPWIYLNSFTVIHFLARDCEMTFFFLCSLSVVNLCGMYNFPLKYRHRVLIYTPTGIQGYVQETLVYSMVTG